MSEAVFVVMLAIPVGTDQNERGHWAQRAGAHASARHAAKIAALQVTQGRAFSCNDKWSVGVCFFTRTKRGDVHNLFGALKPTIDGIADAMGVNDSRFVKWSIERLADKTFRDEVRLTFRRLE